MSHATRVNIGSNRTFQKMKWQTRDDEPAAAYGDYFAHLRSSLAGVPQPIFTLAGENIDFRRIFD